MGMGLGLGMAGGGAVDELHRLLAEQSLKEERAARAATDAADRQLRVDMESARRSERARDDERQAARDAETARHNRETEDNARARSEADEAKKRQLIEGAQAILQNPEASAYDRAVAQAIVQYGPEVPAWVFSNHPALRAEKDKADLKQHEAKARITAKYRKPGGTNASRPAAPNRLITHGVETTDGAGGSGGGKKKSTDSLIDGLF